MNTRMLKCKLSVEEWQERAELLSEEHERLTRLENEHKAVEYLFRQRSKLAKGNIERLAEALRTHEEVRAVECEQRRNEGALAIEMVRTDTGEVLERRPMTTEERQETLPGVA
jgi:hypothetical protein